MTDDELDEADFEAARATAVAAELAAHLGVEVALPPAEAIALVGLLQLALRHPGVPPTSREIAEGFIAAVASAFGPEVRSLIADGANPGHDVEVPARHELLPEVVVDERFPPDTFAVISGDPAHPERGGDAVVRHVAGVDPAMPGRGGPATVVDVRDRAPVPSELLGRRDVVRPAGLIWSGIRVDELERIGYEVLDRAHPDCPCPLEDGEILGDPMTGRIFVWSRPDFDRLAELSRALHDARRRGLPYRPDPQLARVVELLAIDAPSLDIARELSS